MEPITALSVASGLKAFVDFARKMFSSARQPHTSADASHSTVDVEHLRSHLESLTQSLQRKHADTQLLFNSKSKMHGLFEDGGSLRELCIQCIGIAKLLLSQLEELISDPKDEKSEQGEDGRVKSLKRGTKSSDQGRLRFTGLYALLGADGSEMWESSHGRVFLTWKSFQKAFMALWNKKEIEELAAAIQEVRSEVELLCLVLFRQILQIPTVRQAETSQQRIRSTRFVLNAFINDRESLTEHLQTESKRLLGFQLIPLHVATNLADKKVEDRKQLNPTSSSTPGHHFRDFAEQNIPSISREGQVKEEIRLLIIENGILGSLSFATMTDRQESLEIPHGQTLKWIFEEPGESGAPWSNFVQWLREGDGIYWIQGSLGSGKSTLMRYIFEADQTRRQLCSWGHGAPVETLDFYFWNSGDENQRSLRGLLQSLLFNILERHRGFLAKVSPEVWRAWSKRASALLLPKSTSPSHLLDREPEPLSTIQLEQCFHDATMALLGGTKLCLFIDGLDECEEGNPALVDFFHKYAAFSTIKFCLSSRPLLVFEQAFTGRPSLRLQDLTAGDIAQYVQSQLCNHKHVKQVSGQYNAELSRLVMSVTIKGNGVFLWVKLVVNYLLSVLSDRGGISELEQKVEYLPEDIEALYAHILEHIDASSREQMCRIFQIFRAAQQRSAERLTLLNLSWADDQDEALAEQAPIRLLTREETKMRCQAMESRLKISCAALLESSNNDFSDIAPDAKVAFLHRSVSDWLAKEDVWKYIQSRTLNVGFSPNLCMLRSRILNLKGAEISPGKPLDMTLASDALWYAKEAETDLSTGFPTLLDELDKVVSYQWRKGYRGDGISDLDTADTTDSNPLEEASITRSKPIAMPAPSHRNSSLWTTERGDMKSRGSHPHPTMRLAQLQETGVLNGEQPNFYRENFSDSVSPAASALEDKILYHWTYGLELAGVKPPSKTSTFYDAVKAVGLDHYLTMKGESGNIMDRDVIQHLLMEAVPSFATKAADVTRVIKLLESGADPNFSCHGQTPWEHVMTNSLSHLARVRDSSLPHYAEWEETAVAWIRIFSAFVTHGADPSAVVRKPFGLRGSLYMSPVDIVDIYLTNVLSDEAIALKLALAGKINARRECQK